jgi:hypothetical protein
MLTFAQESFGKVILLSNYRAKKSFHIQQSQDQKWVKIKWEFCDNEWSAGHLDGDFMKMKNL